MTTRNYLDKILSMCTPKEIAFFNQIFPGEVPAKDLSKAIALVERTISGSAKKRETIREELSVLENKYGALKNNLHTTVPKLKRRISELEDHNRELLVLSERYTNPITLDNVKVQERLAILDALEAGGVDNWEGYDESLKGVE